MEFLSGKFPFKKPATSKNGIFVRVSAWELFSMQCFPDSQFYSLYTFFISSTQKRVLRCRVSRTHLSLTQLSTQKYALGIIKNLPDEWARNEFLTYVSDFCRRFVIEQAKTDDK